MMTEMGHPNHQHYTAESSSSTTTLGLCYLMVDLEALAAELLVAEEALGLVCTHQALTNRLSRIGVSNQKIESFSAWRQTISGLICDNSPDENHLAKIAAAEKAGLILLAELTEYLRTHNQKMRLSNGPLGPIAA